MGALNNGLISLEFVYGGKQTAAAWLVFETDSHEEEEIWLPKENCVRG